MEFTNEEKLEYLKKQKYIIEKISFPSKHNISQVYKLGTGIQHIKQNYNHPSFNLDYKNKIEHTVTYLKDSKEHNKIKAISENLIIGEFIPTKMITNTKEYDEFFKSLSIDTVFNNIIKNKILDL